MFGLRNLRSQKVRLNRIIYLPCTNFPNYHHQNGVQKRQLSLKPNIESLIQTQSGIFKSISESTPVEYLQKFTMNVHDFTGLPWWGTIICCTVLIRTCVTLPLAIYQYYIMAKLENLKQEMPQIVAELKNETAMAIKLYKWDEKKACITFNRSVRKQWNNLIVRDNCHPFKASLLIWFQIPMWISFSVSLRNLVYMLPEKSIQAQLTLTELTVGGFGWIPNLTEVDSSLILPVTLGLTNLAIIEMQMLSRQNSPTKFQKVMTHMFRGFSVLMIPISASVPSCLVLYWTTSSTYGLLQNLLLMSPRVKRMCGIPPTKMELVKPYSHVMEGLRSKIKVLPGVNK